MKLEIELVPSTSFFKNVRSEVSIEEWDRLRKSCYKQAGYCCEICGGKGEKWPVECHEIWRYDDDKHSQTLTGLIALCPACHEVKHMGLAQIRGREKEAINHFAKVNNFNAARAYREVAIAFEKHQERSQYDWSLDITWLEENK